eukprot:CAMPEP_0201147886 /NCGR_PEP_ID=MMETSP0851-20130426/9406_1 /ASSEMBLY_ACC=CAM_ASM_000631 /TAXON_ID=183588 /ORGANISM="Pseudo-nitzschia fraudulenta, Strain WWA7" /LENGTH=38 /DNA_ID= /DNA_START= /DNA_END= /DNA_ORIENTATION=
MKRNKKDWLFLFEIESESVETMVLAKKAKKKITEELLE